MTFFGHLQSRFRSLTRRALVSWLCLVPLFVLGCFALDWYFLRSALCDALVYCSQVMQLSVERIAIDTIAVNGISFQYTLECTLIHYYCGSIPLLWDRSRSPATNVLRLAALFVALFIFNVARQELSLIGLALGIPWWLAHETIAGVTIFLIVFAVVRRGAWRRDGFVADGEGRVRRMSIESSADSLRYAP